MTKTIKNFISEKRGLFIWGSALAFIIISALILILSPWSPDLLSSKTLGEAEAVMTTKVRVYDGIWDEKRYSDELYSPIGIALKGGNLIIADSMCDRIQIIDERENKRIGRPGQYGLSYLTSGALIDGYHQNARFQKPSDIAVRADGDIIVCDTGNHTIRKMDDDYVITIAGNGKSGYSEGKEGSAKFHAPRSVVVDTDGIIYVADTMNHCIRRIDLKGNVTLYAGTPTISGYRDGALTEAQFFEPCGLYLAKEGELYVADSANHSIRKIANNVVTTVAGMPGEIDKSTGYPQGGYIDGSNYEARFYFPRAVTMLGDGSLVVADSMNHSVRMITADSTKTLFGNGEADGYYGSAENLKLARPEGVYADSEILYISDTLNNRVIAVPLTERILEGRPSREQMLAETGIATSSKYAYRGEIRVYHGSKRVDMGRVKPWNTQDYIYVPIRPFFEALGAVVDLDEKSGLLIITINEEETFLKLDYDYFILKGVAVTTTDEIVRLFPYTFEWFPEFSVITLHIPDDLRLAAEVSWEE